MKKEKRIRWKIRWQVRAKKRKSLEHIVFGSVFGRGKFKLEEFGGKFKL